MRKIDSQFVSQYLLDPSEKALLEEDFFHKFIRKGLDFYSGKLRKNKVFNYMSPKELRFLLDEHIPQNSISDNDLDKLLDMIGEYSILQADKKYLAFPDGGNSKYAIGGAIYSQFLNQNQIAFDRSAPIGTIIEIQLINWLRELIGYQTIPLPEINSLSKVGGMWTTGGNLSNYVALLTALNNRFPSIKERGIHSVEQKPVIVMTRGIEHYSYKSACSWLGLGSNSIIWAEPGKNYTSSVLNIKNAIENSAKDQIPFFVVAVAGNCRTSGLDDLEAISRMCQRYNVWLHVDACHGGSFLFSEKYKHLLKGIENADSVSLDPHKSLFIPYSSSYVLFKNPNSTNVFSRYPDKVNAKEYLDLGLATPFMGSRGFESLKLWLTIKGIGLRAIGKLIERRQYLANYWYQILMKNENVIVFNDLDFYRISFVVFPKRRLDDIKRVKDKNAISSLVSKYTSMVSDRLYKAGNVCMDEFKLNDFNRKITNDEKITYTVIGTTIGNPSTDKESLWQSNELLAIAIEETINKYNNEIDSLINLGGAKETEVCTSGGNSPACWS
ncbi:MAG: pyridoxal-dependent decarboxylase [bacterium]|nr:pyridoxal-dependent decarboxylase [bacterium]